MSTINREISPKDDMFEGCPDHYFRVGQSALDCIFEGLSVANKSTDHVRKILDLPCGYGRVLRYLCSAFPEAEISASDLDEDRVDFCARVFNAKPLYSTPDLRKFPYEETFGLIWVGSLLTHLDHERRKEFWSFFSMLLNPAGLLVVTLHGPAAHKNLSSGHFRYGLNEVQQKHLLEQYQAGQNGYVDYVDTTGFGISIAAPEIYRGEISETTSLQLVRYRESAWDSHHDVAYCTKPSVASTPPRPQ